jgi:hypothetical protein
MALFCRGVPRLLAVGIVVTGFCILPPEALSRGPDLCLWRKLLHLAACPACGSTRALAAFFHGRFGDALAYNRNVLVTAPLLIALAAKDAFSVLRKWSHSVGTQGEV